LLLAFLAAAAAAAAHNTTRVQRLLNRGAPVNVAVGKLSPLHVAAAEGYHEVVHVLVAAGADCSAIYNTASLGGLTPLHLAAYYGHPVVIKHLLKAGAGVDVTCARGGTALHYAVAAAAAGQKHLQVVEQLIKAGASADAKSPDGYIPLLFAIKAGRIEVVKQLVAVSTGWQAPVQGRFATPLHAAAHVGSLEAVELLLAAWGQPAPSVAVLLGAARMAAEQQHMPVLVRLVRQVHCLHKEELVPALSAWLLQEQPVFSANVCTALVDERDADVNSVDAQQAAVRISEEDVASEKLAAQQLLVLMAKQTQQDPPAIAQGPLRRS
jgi:ankyrin repeat protein